MSGLGAASTRGLIWPGDAPATVIENRRREPRATVIKSGKLCFGQSVVDCVIADVSPGGTRVRTGVVTTVPETVILRFAGGGAYVAHQRWARGTDVGFEFIRPAPMGDEHAASIARAAFNALPMDDLSTSIRMLRTSRFFDDPALAKAAEDMEGAYVRFKQTLKDRIEVRS